jgi:hypothetical protein
MSTISINLVDIKQEQIDLVKHFLDRGVPVFSILAPGPRNRSPGLSLRWLMNVERARFCTGL